MVPFPTPVGMNRMATVPGIARPSVPHARGDEPVLSGQEKPRNARSPRPWG